MPRKLLLVMLFSAFYLLFGSLNQSYAQSRKAVGAAEVNGTFRDYFTGKFKGNYNEIKILALGKGKLKIAFGLTYPHIDGTGNLSANVGEAEGEATISGDEAIFTSEDLPECKIIIKFVKPGTIDVNQQGSDSDCGFGFNVSATGTYKKTNGAKPKFN